MHLCMFLYVFDTVCTYLCMYIYVRNCIYVFMYVLCVVVNLCTYLYISEHTIHPQATPCISAEAYRLISDKREERQPDRQLERQPMKQEGSRKQTNSHPDI